MIIEFKKEDFLKSLQVVISAIKKGNLYQILDCVLIDASKNNISLIAQDGKEISIKKEAMGDIIEKGKAAIDGRYLLDIIRTMPDDSFINLNVNEKKECIISCGENNKTKLQAKDEETYPNIISVNKEKRILLNEYKLRKIIEKTIFSYDKNNESGNIVLKGIYFNLKNGILQVKSMDGYIVSIINERVNEDKESYEAIIPGSALEELYKILNGEVEKDINIYFNEKNVSFEFDGTLFTSIIIPNNYIDTDRIFNVDHSTKVTLNKKDFFECLNRSITVLRENDNKPVIFDIKENKMEINLNSLYGESHQELEINKSGKDLMIAFNAKNLIKILRVLNDENINLFFSGAKQPVIIKDKQETYSYLLTPVKI